MRTLFGPRRRSLVLAILLLHAWGSFFAFSQDKKDGQDKPQDVTDIDLDDLLKVRVTSAGRKEQSLNDVPSAIYVIREEDLKRTGATSLAEALRGVPGMQVARTRAGNWAVSGRGFNSSGNKLLVLIDGRSVYSPLHSGVFWEVQDTFLEDVDRIEVIRGPGASLWGSNAINGVVNVITKKSQDTQGGVVTVGGGTEERGFGGARYGTKIGEDQTLRVYGKYFVRDDAQQGLNPDHRARDGWWMGQGGFRTDWKSGEHDRFAVMGDFYDGQTKMRSGEPSLTPPFFRAFNDRTSLRGGNVVFRWDREIDDTSSLSLQAYYDYTFRSAELFADTVHTGDLDFQHRFRLFDNHDIIWGLGYRLNNSELDGSFTIQSNPTVHTDSIASAFIQDEITLIKDRLRLTLGTKLEYNDYTGIEVEPSGRLAWNPDDRQLVWLSVSRAVRTPSIVDLDLRINAAVIPGAPPTLFSIFGDPNFRSEDLVAYEAGYRVRPADSLTLDLALFYNRYGHLRTLEALAPFSEADPAPTHTLLPFEFANEMKGQSGGFELAANYQPLPWWLIQANYSYLRVNLNLKSGSKDTFSEAGEKQDPRHQVWIRSAMDLPENLTLDVMGRYVSGLSAFKVNDYIEMDVRIAWHDDSRRWEAALVGQNLIHQSHPEFGAAASRSEIQRGVYASLTCRF